jgi:4'-phosphopantetheinyl transferase
MTQPLICPPPTFSTPKPLTARQAQLWLVDLRCFGDEHKRAALAMMSTDERERVQAREQKTREQEANGQNSYIASRWLLRSCLARYTGTAPAQLVFARTDKGKPYLAGSNIHFSLSHSGHWVVLAVSASTQVGVDVEVVRRARGLQRIAQNYFHPAEVEQLARTEPQDQETYFYRLWTLKEAFFKALGTGISAGLGNIHFVLDEPESQRPIRADIDPALVDTQLPWQFHQWQLAEREFVALAYTAATPWQIDWYDALTPPAFP